MAEETDKRTTEEKETHRRLWKRTGLEDKTLWDLLQLLIVPLALAAIGFFFTLQQDARQQAIEDQRAASERKIEEHRAQDAALQAYLDHMSSLLLAKNGLRESKEGSEESMLARARTITVLERLAPSRKTAIIQFLIEANLVQSVGGRAPIITLGGANLSDADLTTSNYSDLLNVSGLGGACLSGANLHDAHVSRADLSGADLGADLNRVNLTGAVLLDAKLSGVDLTKEERQEAITTMDEQRAVASQQWEAALQGS